MCVVCGCTNPNGPPVNPGAAPETAGPSVDPRTGDLHYGVGEARVSVPGMSPARAIRLEADVLGANRRVAEHNRAHFIAHGVTALNLVSSPGSGKTSLLVATIRALQQHAPDVAVAVIEGDQQTAHDADRIRATGAPAIQVNTGKGCHLDAPMVAAAYAQLPGHGQAHAHEHGPAQEHEHEHEHEHDHAHHDHDHAHAHGTQHSHHHNQQLLFIENVGNLVCPAMWDLGEAAKVAILSVTEGEDKPLKYPDMFAAARLMVLNKVDLLPHVDFNVEQCIAYARRVNPAIEVIQLSATKGTGMQAWLDWLLHFSPEAAAAGAEARLRRRVVELEAALKARLDAELAAQRAQA